jgi:ureidoglycolate hydrolase
MDVVIEVHPLDSDAFAPFGWLPVTEGDEADERQQLTFEWADVHLNYIAHAPDELVRVPEGAVVERLYRHQTHTQALTPVNTDSVIVVAPPSAACSADALRAFLLHPLDTVVLHRGTWHWGPFPVGDEPVRLLNLQGRRYREDNESTEPSERVVVRMPASV